MCGNSANRQLNDVEIDSENRVEAAAKQVANLREEVAELRATVKRQAELVTDGAEYDFGAICGHRDTLSEPGGFKYRDAALGGMPESRLLFSGPTRLSTSSRTSPPPTPPCTPPVLCTPHGAGPSRWRKPAELSGDVVWEAYQRQFECVARGQGWDDTEKAYQLIASLRGSASQVLAQLTNAQCLSYQRLAEALQQRFGVTLQAEVYRTQLKERASRQGEPLPRLAQDLEALVRRAYPSAPQSMVAVLARDHFIDALGDQ
ncbi:hypothetical protein E2C01_064908 [Portunus trituberculatus]|uniref:Uncharacterized protein n=1 Tax=Portunus trituberculatus TaxID=210409 RepID=A0A5B7HKG3_PORTR|nr:hypothetical protein [Portunus trituberculatus]